MIIPRVLTAEESKKPYARYYYQPTAPPDEALMKSMTSGAMDTQNALLPENINDLLLPGYLPGENGWCILPNGVGHVATCMKMPGVTIDMINWWFAWHPLESLRYMLWYPSRHYSIWVSDEDRNKILDTSIPIQDKIANVVHHIREDSRERDDLTEIPPEFEITFRYPWELGFDMSRFHAPSVGTVICAFPPDEPDGSPPARPRIMCHFVRETSDGVELRSRFWMGGYRVSGGKPTFIGMNSKTPESAAFGLAKHCVMEYSNLRTFLPILYREQKGRLTI